MGILISHLLFFKREVLCSLFLFLIFCASLVILARIREKIERNIDRANLNKDIFMCLLFVSFGFLIMLLNCFNSRTLDEKNLSEIVKIRGRIVSCEENKDYTVFDIDTFILGRKTKVRCSEFNKNLWNTKKEKIKYGDLVMISGKLEIPSKARNPGCFDYRSYLLTKKIVYIMKASEIKHNTYKGIANNNFYNNIWKYRKKLQVNKEKFLHCIAEKDTKVYGFIKGITFGDSSSLDKNTIDEFRDNTTAHVLAVSGLHVGIIYGMLRIMTFGRYSYLIAIFTTAVMCLYGEITMWNISTARAVILVIIAVCSFYVSKPFDLLTALSVAFMIMLTYNPFLIFGASFEMSFLAVAGIAFFTENLGRVFGNEIGFLISLQLAMAPYTCFIFNKFNPIGIIINIPVVFIVSLLVPLAIVGITWQFIIGRLPYFITVFIKSVSILVIKLNTMLHMDGKFSKFVVTNKLPGILIYYGIIFFLFSEFTLVLILRKKYREVITCIIVIIICVLPISIGYGNKFLNDEVVFVDVGQGDCIHIRDGNKNILVDGGGNISRNIGETVLKEYFLKNGISGLDGSIFTHMHLDHAKGAIELGKVYPIHDYYVPYAYTDTVKGKKFKVIRFADRIVIGKDVWIKAIWPIKNSKISEQDSMNENNTVYLLYYNGVKILLTGDLVEDDELDMIKYYENTDYLDCDILKVAHHGSKYSTTEAMLQAAKPEIAVIQVGKNNIYGHPAKDTVKRLKKYGVKVYRNDLHGAIGIDIKQEKFRVDRMI